MFPMAADPTAPVSRAGVKQSAPSDHEERPNGRSKGASPHQVNNSTGKAKVVANAQDHGSDGANERHLAIDINKVTHQDDGDLDNPLPATTGDVRCSLPPQHLHRALSLDSKMRELEIKMREMEIEERMLELELERVQWAAENLREEMELKNMRLENDGIRLGNHRLLVEIKRKELELSVVRSKRV